MARHLFGKKVPATPAKILRGRRAVCIKALREMIRELEAEPDHEFDQDSLVWTNYSEHLVVILALGKDGCLSALEGAGELRRRSLGLPDDYRVYEPPVPALHEPSADTLPAPRKGRTA